MTPTIPVVLFAYSRPHYLARTLACLRENEVPLLIAYVDGPRRPEDAPKVADVLRLLRSVDWCELQLHERSANLGLGRSIVQGVGEALAEHEAVVVFEDDLVCSPGTYAFMCAGLRQYRDDPRVMSVTGRSHPRILPRGVDQPYFDGRPDCLTWGTWRRAWQGMEREPADLLAACEAAGRDIYRHGADMVEMARRVGAANQWAVRFYYLHLLKQGLCLRPPGFHVEHIGFDADSTNVSDPSVYAWHAQASPLPPAIPTRWPEPIEHPDCPRLWRRSLGGRPSLLGRARRLLGRMGRSLYPRLGAR
jgi:hypothetical protein